MHFPIRHGFFDPGVCSRSPPGMDRSGEGERKRCDPEDCVLALERIGTISEGGKNSLTGVDPGRAKTEWPIRVETTQVLVLRPTGSAVALSRLGNDVGGSGGA